MVREVKRTDLGTEAKKLPWRRKRDGWSVRFICFKPFPLVLYLRLFSDFFFPLRLRHPLSLVPALSPSLFCRCYMQKNESKDRKGSPCLSMVSLSFLVFPAFSSPSSLLLLAFLISQQRKDEGKKLLRSLFFSLLHTASLMFFLVFLFLFFPPLLLSFSFLSPFNEVFTVTKGWKKRPPPPFSALWPVLGAKTEAGWGGGRSSRKGLVWPLFSLFSVLLPFFFFFVPFFSQ